METITEKTPPTVSEETADTLVSEKTSPQCGLLREGSSLPFSGSPRVGNQSRTHELLDGCKRVLQLARASKEVIRSFLSQGYNYLNVDPESVFFKRAKYFLILPMSRFLKADPPKEPDLPFFPVGDWKRWMKSRMILNNQNCWLWYSLLQGKRSAQPVSKELVHQTYLDHRAQMLQLDPLPDDKFNCLQTLLGPFLDKISKQVARQYNADSRHPFDFEPSNSACFESTRAKGGARERLRSLVPGLKTRLFDHRGRRCYPTEFVRMDFYPIVVIDGTVHYNKLVEVFEDPPSLRNLWISTLSYECMEYRLPSIRKCEIQAVLEPLKVRVISKGEALPYYYSKKLQHTLHSVLRKYPCFSLIGESISLEKMEQCRQAGSDFWRFCNSSLMNHFSIDYSAATDGLSARLSAWILKRIVSKFPISDQELWLSVLAPHHCSYPTLKHEGRTLEVPPVDQVNGQLMGSILSFPILCLANLGLYCMVINSPATRKILQTVLINGDDMYYYGPKTLWQDHVSFGEYLGLRMSPGKAYCHPRYANMNSAMFDMKNSKYIPFFNGGLYKGQHKVLGRVGEDCENQTISSVFDEMIRGVPEKFRPTVCAQWLSYHSNTLNQELKGRNLFIHESLGGAGQTAPDGFHVRITDWQRRLASKMLDSGKLVSRDAEVVEIPEITPSLPVWAPKVVAPRKFYVVGNHQGYLSRAQCLDCRADMNVTIPYIPQSSVDIPYPSDEFDDLSDRMTAVMVDHELAARDRKEEELRRSLDGFVRYQNERDAAEVRKACRINSSFLEKDLKGFKDGDYLPLPEERIRDIHTASARADGFEICSLELVSIWRNAGVLPSQDELPLSAFLPPFQRWEGNFLVPLGYYLVGRRWSEQDSLRRNHLQLQDEFRLRSSSRVRGSFLSLQQMIELRYGISASTVISSRASSRVY